jgi:hypothetical protein
MNIHENVTEKNKPKTVDVLHWCSLMRLEIEVHQINYKYNIEETIYVLTEFCELRCDQFTHKIQASYLFLPPIHMPPSIQLSLYLICPLIYLRLFES